MSPIEPGATTSPLHVGQLNMPDRQRVLEAFDGIFERQFYTNHGPLVAEFEQRIADRLGVEHVICTTNGTMALMVAATSLVADGDVVVPAFTFPATAQALSFAKLRPVFCDVDPESHLITPATVRAALTPDTKAIVGVHMWGQPCDIDGLNEVADEIDAKVMFDAAHAFGCAAGDSVVGSLGSLEVFSFHATKILNCAEGGCVTTNDADVAAAVRTAANFHDQVTYADVPLRINAKMSEAQAALGLLSLDDLDVNLAANAERYERYRTGLAGIDGIDFVDHAASIVSNHQYVVAVVDAHTFGSSRDDLLTALAADGIVAKRYFSPGLHLAEPYAADEWHVPNTDALNASLVQLPTGQAISLDDVDRVVGAIRSVADH